MITGKKYKILYGDEFRSIMLLLNLAPIISIPRFDLNISFDGNEITVENISKTYKKIIAWDNNKDVGVRLALVELGILVK